MAHVGGDSLGLDTKLVVLDGPHKSDVIFHRFTISGATDGQKKAGRISASTLRQILESARNVAPDPTKSSPAWLQAVKVNSYGDFHGLCFLIKVGIAPARDGYPAKNVIKSVIVPNMPEYQGQFSSGCGSSIDSGQYRVSKLGNDARRHLASTPSSLLSLCVEYRIAALGKMNEQRSNEAHDICSAPRC
jgi:hypothetical protein